MVQLAERGVAVCKTPFTYNIDKVQTIRNHSRQLTIIAFKGETLIDITLFT